MRNIHLLYYLLAALLLFGCGVNEKEKDSQENELSTKDLQESKEKEIEQTKLHNSHKSVSESTWGELPKGIKEAENPKYPVGTKVIIHAAHDDGEMEGQEGVVVGAYDTVAYSVTYQPTNGDQEQVGYKWLVQEELKGMADAPLKVDSKVIIEANHEAGMTGAEGVIETAHDTTVYMVDYTAKDGRKVKNYQWFIESELSPK